MVKIGNKKLIHKIIYKFFCFYLFSIVFFFLFIENKEYIIVPNPNSTKNTAVAIPKYGINEISQNMKDDEITNDILYNFVSNFNFCLNALPNIIIAICELIIKIATKKQIRIIEMLIVNFNKKNRIDSNIIAIGVIIPNPNLVNILLFFNNVAFSLKLGISSKQTP